MDKIPATPLIKLYPGRVPEQYFRGLADISSIRSQKVIKALYEHFVEGLSRTHVSNEHSVCPGYLSIKIREIKSLHEKVNDLYDIYIKLSDVSE
ncbi:PapB/FocB family fimbrial expression transcriptional regulator [Citrobacter meridianamericanus]|uniref:PapB/FocB family fimbrial expression transcriptional regulator n=1 Tax=Citrobacter meridianamericanus TaxID=2894201 RepID=UPI00351D9B7A